MIPFHSFILGYIMRLPFEPVWRDRDVECEFNEVLMMGLCSGNEGKGVQTGHDADDEMRLRK